MNLNTKIAVDLGGTNLRVGLIKENKLVEKIQLKLLYKDDKEKTIQQLKGAISQLITKNVKGIGLGVPSVVDVEKGIVYNVANIPSWDEVHLKDILEDEYNVPVFVNNDVNCFVLGEHAFGQGNGCSSLVGLAIGTGLGAGIIVDNKLYEGNNAGAGEIGLLPYLERDLEFYCSSTFFTEINNTGGKELEDKARAGDANAIELWKEFGKHMAQAIKYVILAYDPQMVVLGGSISNAYDLFKKSMYENLMDFAYPNSVKRLKITLSDKPDSNLLGASCLVKI
jgi:glucokinase